MLPDIQPGNTKILYFFNCLLDGMHTIGSLPGRLSLNELNSNSIDSFPSLVYDKFTLFYLLKGRCPIKEETWFLE